MTIDEMKNKISMELRSTDTQLGFEVICKNLMEHEKVNAELKEKLDEYVNIVEDDEVKCVKLQEKNEQLKAEIESLNGEIRVLIGANQQLNSMLKVKDECAREYIEQIEKMKCGGNCKHSYSVNTGGYYDTKCELTGLDCINCKDKWELSE